MKSQRGDAPSAGFGAESQLYKGEIFMLKLFFETLKRKFYIPLILAVVCAGGIAAEKAMFPAEFRVTDTGFIEKVYLIKSDAPLPEYLDFKQAMLNYSSLMHFFEENAATKEFDFTKFNRKWDLMSLAQQGIWFENRFHYIRGTDNVLILRMYIDKNFEPDVNYMHDKAEAFFDKVAAHSFKTFENYEINATFVEKDKLVLLPEKVAPPTPKRTLAKYGAAGFILGGALGLFIIALISYRRKNNG